MKAINTINSENGFTLIELILVILIVGLTSMVTYPYLIRTYEDYRIYRQTSRILDGLNLARSYSVRYGSNVTVIFDTDKKSYTTFEDTDRDGIKDQDEKILYENKVEKGVDMYDVSFGSGSKLSFDMSGNVTQLGHVYLKRENLYRAVVVRSLAGNIVIKKSNDGGETWQ